MQTKIPLGSIAVFEMGQSPDSQFVNELENGVPFLQGNAEFGTTFPNHRLSCSQPSKLCKTGDILISVRAPVGALNKADQVYCIGRGLAAIHFVSIDPTFGWHLINYWSRDLRKVSQGSTFEAVDKDELSLLKIGWTPDKEQRAIAAVLDTVDDAIQRADQLIAKLKLIKAGLLHDLLTHGIDAEGNLRDPVAHPEQFKESALGLIPREWEIIRVENVLSEIIDYRGKTPPKSDEGIPLITAKNVRQGFIDIEPKEYIPANIYESWMNRGIPDIGDVLFTTEAPLGNVALVPEYQFSPGQRLLTLQANRDLLNSKFLLWLLLWENSQKRLWERSTGSTVIGIKQSVFRKIQFSIPGLREQRQISNILDAHDSRIRSEEAARDKLKLLKAGLMDDLLTGRVRVGELNIALL